MYRCQRNEEFFCSVIDCLSAVTAIAEFPELLKSAFDFSLLDLMLVSSEVKFEECCMQSTLIIIVLAW